MTPKLHSTTGRKLLLSKMLIGAFILSSIVLLNLPRTRTLKIYLPSNAHNPGITWNPPAPGAADPKIQARIDSIRLARQSALMTTQPFSVLYDENNFTLNIDPKLNKNILVQYGSSINVIVDSPEMGIARSKAFDEMIAKGIHPNQMAPHLPFVTQPHKFPLKPISKLMLGGYQSENGSFSSDGMYQLPKEIILGFDSTTRIDLCFFDSAKIEVGNTKNLSLVSNKFSASVLNASATSVEDGGSTFSYSVINIVAQGFYFRQTKFSNTKLSAHSYSPFTYVDCHFENSYFESGTGNVKVENVVLSGDNTIQIDKLCSLTNLKGNGSLELVSTYVPFDGFKQGIDEFAKRYGSTKSLKKELRSIVTLNRVSISKLRFSPREIYFLIDSAQDYIDKEKIYAELIDYFKDNEDERKIYDIQLRKMRVAYEDDWWGYLKDYCQENWNNYGYENGRIWPISGIVFLALYIVNLLFFPIILLFGYQHEEFVVLYRKSIPKPLVYRLRFEVVYSFLYTLLLFSVISLDWGKLKIANLAVAFWLIFQHAVSLLLITFIVRSIFS